MKKILSILSILLFFNCKKTNTELEHLIHNDSIQHWNYEWKRNYPDEFGETFGFNKNGDLLKYFYVKESGLRQIYWDDMENPYRWSIKSDSLLIDNAIHDIHQVYKIIHFNRDTIKLVNSKIKDTSLLLRVEKKFDVLIKTMPNTFLVNPKTKDTAWIFTK